MRHKHKPILHTDRHSVTLCERNSGMIRPCGSPLEKSETDSLPEGATATVLAAAGDESFTLGPDEDVLLLAVIAEAEQGNTISASVLLRRIPTR